MSLSTRSVDLEVIPKKATRNKEKPHLARQFEVVLPAIVEHPIRGSTHDEEIGENNSASNRVVLEIPSIARDHPERGLHSHPQILSPTEPYAEVVVLLRHSDP
jgi:hypothetical protein